MTDLIVETDLGHDPDDFFTLCYLAAAGVRLRAVCVVPGDRDQLAVARMLVKTLGLDIPVGASKPDSRKSSSGGMHHAQVHEFERSGAAWTLEWLILPQLVMSTGAALRLALALTAQIQTIGGVHG